MANLNSQLSTLCTQFTFSLAANFTPIPNFTSPPYPSPQSLWSCHIPFLIICHPSLCALFSGIQITPVSICPSLGFIHSGPFSFMPPLIIPFVFSSTEPRLVPINRCLTKTCFSITLQVVCVRSSLQNTFKEFHWQLIPILDLASDTFCLTVLELQNAGVN